MSEKITLLDRSFWITESEANPKHVGGLQLLEMPKNAPDNYVELLLAELKSFDKGVAPFNCKVDRILGYPHKLTPINSLDMDYHVRMHELDDINNKPETHKFIATLHADWLDRDKPLWQYHLIKDKQNNGFAIYVKVHHMYGDGATLMRWFQQGYSEKKNTNNFVPVWAVVQKPKVRKKGSLVKKRLASIWEIGRASCRERV